MRPIFILLCLFAWEVAWSQSDALVSKFIGRVITDRDQAWTFNQSGLGYSRIDFFVNPIRIQTDSLNFSRGIDGGAGRDTSLLLFFHSNLEDSLSRSHLLALDRQGRLIRDSITFQAKEALQTQDAKGATIRHWNYGVGVSSLSIAGDRMAVGGGRAGFALQNLKPEGAQPISADTNLTFWALPQKSDTIRALLVCRWNTTCSIDTLSSIFNGRERPDSVSTLALVSSSASPDSTWLLVGTDRGLRRGIAGGNHFPLVSLPGTSDSVSLPIHRIYAHPENGIVWIFSDSRYFYSDDFGASFRIAPKSLAGVDPVQEFSNFSSPPQAVFAGDTAYVNFNLTHPGLAVFRRDSLQPTIGSPLLDASDSLDVSREQGRITALGFLHKEGSTALIVGTSDKGLLYRIMGPGRAGMWQNENRQRTVSRGLREVITFPTVFKGDKDVGIGYRLDKDARVSITVYNYAMEKVRVIVSNAPRQGGKARSENPMEDKWDGKDAGGRHVSVGIYYILVESDKGEKAWGKAIAAHGR